jgi:hypothetical protein
MKRQLGVLTAGWLVLGLVGSLIGTTISYQEPVTTVVFDTDSAGGQLLLRSDDSNGTGGATYANSRTLTSAIQSNGEWRLQWGSQSTRALWITPNDPIGNSQPPGPAAGYYAQGIETVSVCRDQSGNIVPFENLVNGSNNCSLGVDFISGGIEYKLFMSPSGMPADSGSSCPSTGCPATGLTTVTCNTVSSNQCVNWTIAPNLTAPNATVASLFSYTGTRAQPWVFIGQYRNTFRINATHP